MAICDCKTWLGYLLAGELADSSIISVFNKEAEGWMMRMQAGCNHPLCSLNSAEVAVPLWRARSLILNVLEQAWCSSHRKAFCSPVPNRCARGTFALLFLIAACLPCFLLRSACFVPSARAVCVMSKGYLPCTSTTRCLYYVSPAQTRATFSAEDMILIVLQS